MKCLDEQLAFPLFEVHLAQGSEGNAAAGVKRVDHPLGGRTILKLGLQHPKHIGGNSIQFELRGVSQPALSLDFLDVLASQVHLEQLALLRQRLLDRTDDFGHGGTAFAGEGNHVPVAGDIDSGLIMGPGNQSSAVVGEQFRVDRSAKDAQRMFRYRGAD